MAIILHDDLAKFGYMFKNSFIFWLPAVLSLFFFLLFLFLFLFLVWRFSHHGDKIKPSAKRIFLEEIAPKSP